MGAQTYPRFEVFVYDDGSDEPMLTWVREAVAELGEAAHVVKFLEHERQRKPDDPDGHPGYPRWAKQYNTVFPQSRGQIVGILSSDWMPEPDFLSTVAGHLEHLGPGNMVFGDVPEQKVTKAFYPEGATSGLYPVYDFTAADTRNQNFLWRQDWQDWDETFDEFGFGHAMPYWNASVVKKGRCKLWVSLDMKARENMHDNPPEFIDQVNASARYYVGRMEPWKTPLK
jgi:hypothetical protein